MKAKQKVRENMKTRETEVRKETDSIKKDEINKLHQDKIFAVKTYQRERRKI